jgi:hypothetical protein
MPRYTHVNFDSISHLAATVEHLHTTDAYRKRGEASTSDYNPDFYGGWTMDEAIATGTNGGGWREGADLMPRVNVAHETLKGGLVDAPVILNSVAGFMPDVPTYLAGVPECMYQQEQQPVSPMLIRVAVHVGRSSPIEQEQIANRGAAIMAVLDQLSNEGYSVQLDAIWRNADGPTGISVETCIKHGCDHWSPESVAFALCHASFQRRLCWRIAENVNHGTGCGLTGDGYGNGMSADFSDYDLSFGYMTPSIGRDFNDIDSAVAEVKRSTIEQLEKLDIYQVAA